MTETAIWPERRVKVPVNRQQPLMRAASVGLSIADILSRSSRSAVINPIPTLGDMKTHGARAAYHQGTLAVWVKLT